MPTARARPTMAIVLLTMLLASHTASCLVRHGVVGCQPSGNLLGRSGNCETSNSPDCCVDGKQYLQFLCSPPVSLVTCAVLTVNGFSKGKDGGLPSECDSTGMSRCSRSIKITVKGGSSVYAKVVDECDSVDGCDAEHNYEEPCAYNVVDASPAVWDALGLDQNIGLQDVIWSDE
ncbi:hypothetical protein VPH35_112613 [Triticum aestivum]